MKQITAEQFHVLLEATRIKPRVRREVRFAASTAALSPEDWEKTELLAVSDKAGNKGVLVMQAQEDEVYLTSYELSRGITSSTGKAQPIICDFCRTWQTGSRSGSITLARPGRDTGSVAFLCCADLHCSRHVRNLTSAAKTSRAQLREDMTNEQRAERLQRRIEEICKIVGLMPLPIEG
ncbi:MAG TPA: FBP domain-containing protein [Dongiaceae bacterium]|nr:FBP domain-containing protein [Dongiaceae bacterium]